jgi:shikimate dehydrogenase
LKRYKRATALVAAVRDRFGADLAGANQDLAALLPAADGLVNATPIGIRPPRPAPARRAAPGRPLGGRRRLPPAGERAAPPGEEARLPHADGRGMVVFQAAHAFRFFTGVEPDAERMLADLVNA